MSNNKPTYDLAWQQSLLKSGVRGATEFEAALQEHLHADLVWRGPHPINTLNGVESLLQQFWLPLLAAIPDLGRRDDIRFQGHGVCEDWVCATGYYVGNFRSDWLGIPATGTLVNIRFGEFCRINDGKAAEVCLILDLPSLMHQAGVLPLPGGVGTNPWVPAPQTQDGLVSGEPALEESARSLALVSEMLDGLMRYDKDRRDLENMEQHLFWAPDMMWYGPVGIGSTRTLAGFREFHQIPFLEAFPDRKGGNHKARMSRGVFAASTGWPSMHATHLGDYLGVPATGRRVEMRVMDFWRREGKLLAENWVFIDLPHLLLQMDFDIFARMRAGLEN